MIARKVFPPKIPKEQKSIRQTYDGLGQKKSVGFVGMLVNVSKSNNAESSVEKGNEIKDFLEALSQINIPIVRLSTIKSKGYKSQFHFKILQELTGKGMKQ